MRLSIGRSQHTYLSLFATIAVGLTALRVVALFFSDANLGQDEIQYWFWSKTPAFGYFSKPPLIAWTISATTTIFGDAEWAIRLAAPFYHLGAAIFLFALTRKLADETAGFWAGLTWLTLPGVTLSTMLVSTDAPMLFFWSAGLYFFFRMIEARADNKSSAEFAAILGVTIGLGFLSKYAMVYFPIGAVAAAITSPYVRKNIRWQEACLSAVATALVVAPNIWWNAGNKFQTLSHTAANANWSSNLFHPVELIEFLTGQIAVVGPVALVLIIFSMSDVFKNRKSQDFERAIALTAFVLPPVLIVSVQSLISRAHANWAAAAYPAAVVLIAICFVTARRRKILKLNFALNFFLSVILVVGVVNFRATDAAGLSNSIKRVRGWDAHGADIAVAASKYSVIMADDREIMGAVLYYARPEGSVISWNSNSRIDHHYEAFLPFDESNHEKIFYITALESAAAVSNSFDSVKLLGFSRVDLKRGRSRTLYYFELSGYRP